MPVKGNNSVTPDATTQRYLQFSQIRENIILLKDDSGRLVLECSSVNFLLKSEDEQNSIIMSFQRFLNSLDFPVQILVRSKKLDLNSYITNIEKIGEQQQNELLKNQTLEYTYFLRQLVEVAQIMKKEFYIIIPFDLEDGKSVRDTSLIGLFKNFWASINNSVDVTKVRIQLRNFSKIKKGLKSKVNTIRTSLENIGLKVTELDKEGVIKLLTDYYNPSLESTSIIRSDIGDYNIIQN